MELHLFSTPGPGPDITWVLDACQKILNGKKGATVAFLPAGSLYAPRWVEQARGLFGDLARIETIDTEMMDLPSMQAVLRRASMIYIPGGNAYLLSHRLHVSGLFPYLRTKIHNGLPVVAFSAGTVVCGPNILTSNDLNMVPTPHFDGLGATPFNLNVHYAESAERDNWLSEYQSFHDNAVLMLEDGAHMQVQGKTTTLVQGRAWCWRAGREKERLSIGEAISPNEVKDERRTTRKHA